METIPLFTLFFIKVKSAVIRLRRNATVRLDCDETLFVRVVKAAFGQRRKNWSLWRT